MRIYFARPIHPGEMLQEEFMVPLGLTAGKLAKALGLPRTRIERLVREQTALTTDTSLRLARYFNMTVEFWTNMQAGYEIDCAHASEQTRRALDAITPLARPEERNEAA